MTPPQSGAENTHGIYEGIFEPPKKFGDWKMIGEKFPYLKIAKNNL
jgi:hypothetical protein